MVVHRDYLSQSTTVRQFVWALAAPASSQRLRMNRLRLRANRPSRSLPDKRMIGGPCFGTHPGQTIIVGEREHES
jgi:hypothetical protein